MVLFGKNKCSFVIYILLRFFSTKSVPSTSFDRQISRPIKYRQEKLKILSEIELLGARKTT